MHEPDDRPAGLTERALRELEEDGAWLERLAVTLGGDPAAAADAAQVAWVHGWRMRSEGRPATRSWLRTALLRALRRDARATTRRSARQRRAAREEAIPSEPPALERLETQRVVLDAVGRLDEPYRSVVVERFLAAKSISEIARACDVPEKTVRTRIARALERLRRDLDGQSDGDRRTWLESLALFAPRPARQVPLVRGGLLMGIGTKLTLSSVAVFALSLAGWWVHLDGRSSDPTATVAIERAARVLQGEPGRRPPIAELGGTSARRAPSVDPVPELRAAADGRSRLVGRVVTADGSPVASVDVGIWRDSVREQTPRARSTTDSRGAFELPPLEGGFVDLISADWTVLYRPAASPGTEDGGLEVLALPAHDGVGVVVDEGGRPLAGVSVRGEVDFSVYLARSDGRGGSRVEERSTRTAEDGRFELRALPVVDGSMLLFEHPGHRSRRLAVGELGAGPVEVVLRRASGADGHLVGRVVDPSGAPVAGAWVTTGGPTLRTGVDGAFQVRINALPSASSVVLRAVAPGLLPVERRVPLPTEAPEVLVLETQSLSITGTLDGAGHEEVLVWLDGARSFGSVDRPIDGVTFRVDATCEDLMAGGDGDGRALQRRTANAFEFTGLRDVAYDLHAVDPTTLRTVTLLEVPAGSHGLVVRWPGASAAQPLTGRVVDDAGSALTGVHVAARIPWSPTGPELEGGPALTTDGDGRFAFPDIALEEVELVLRDPEERVRTELVLLDSFDGREGLQITLTRVVRARFEVENPLFTTGHVQVLDADGATLPIRILHAGRDALTDRTFLHDGRSGVVWFPEDAVLARVVTESGTLEAPLDPGSWADGVVTIR
ncbi:MAG: sigma-70 family RNA polymerase sigma factor [Planctomycetota bacterium]